VPKLWVRWVESKEVVYPKVVQGTWMRIWEIVATVPRVKEANTYYIAQLPAPPPPTPPVAVATPPTPLAIATFSSEGSNSVVTVAPDDEDEE